MEKGKTKDGGKKKTLERAKMMSDLLYLNERFVVLDLETTGLSPDKGGVIIEVAGVKVESNQIVDTFHSMIDPERKVPKKTTELTGITDADVHGQPVYGQVLPRLYDFIGDAVVVAHNSMFDWDRYLLHFFPKVGLFPKNKVIDTLALSKLYFPEQKKHGLEILCANVGVELDGHHRALNDTRATANALIELKKRYTTKLFNESVGDGNEQMDLFSQATDEVEEVDLDMTVEETRFDTDKPSGYSVRRVKYWEKAITKKQLYQRLYVTLSIGTAFFDMRTKTWYNKDVKENIDFEALSRSVLKYLHLQTVDDLCGFRN